MAGGTRKASRTKQPITRHPLFPAIVALWFCALFGLGSLAIRVALIENAVVASGIDLIVPAAAPPLGVTARILMALMLGLFGALIGYALGSRLSQVRTDAPQRRRTNLSSEEPAPPRRADRFIPATASAPPRPLSAFDELDEDGKIAPDAQAVTASPRRRSLALTEPLEPDYACITAPLPGGDAPPPASCANEDTDVLELAEALPEETFVTGADPFVPVSAAVTEAAPPAESFAAPTAPAHDTAPAPRLFDQGGPSRRFAKPGSSTSPASDPDQLPIPRLRAADPFAAIDPEEDDQDLPPRNLGPRFGAPVAENDTANEPEAIDFPVAIPAPSAVQPEPAPVAMKPAVTGSAAERLRATPLEQLSQLELIERLALSMQQRRQAAEAAAAEAATATPAPAPVEPAFPASPEPFPRFGFEPRTPLPLDEPPTTFATPQPAPELAPDAPAVPAALRPIGFDLEPADDEAADDLVPHFAFARPQPAPPVPSAFAPVVTEPDEAEDAMVESEEFSSLLDLGRAPLRSPLIRIEEPTDADAPIEPVVVFPGHGSRPFATPAPAEPEPAPAPLPVSQPGMRRFDAPAAQPTQPAPVAAAPRQDPEETERALRAALATLQRMSGAA